MYTYLQAKEHLETLILMCTHKNLYLSCVRTYLRAADVDVISKTRAQDFKDHNRIIEILDLQARAEDAIANFLTGRGADA